MTTFRLTATGLLAGVLSATTAVAQMVATQPAAASSRKPAISPLAGSERHAVDCRLPGGLRMHAIYESPGQRIPTRDRGRRGRVVHSRKSIAGAPRSKQATGGPKDAAAQAATVPAYVLHSPPLDGFTPYIAVLATDRHRSNDYWDADSSLTVLGNYLVSSPQTDYAIGLFDTGAGVSVLSNANAERLGLFSHDFNTGGTVGVGGVTGTVDAWVSQPFGLWMTGLGNIDPTTGLLNTSTLMGEWNVSVAMGDTPAPGAPDLATAIGAPMAVYYAAAVRNDTWHSLNLNGATYEAPDITFYDVNSASIPSYPNRIALELRPLGGADVWFWPCFAVLEDCPGGDGSPSIPSTILGISSQSLYFIASVNCSDAGRSANGQTRFMLDTGAQVTVVGTRVGGILGLNPAQREFTVEIEGVDGTVSYEPGFYIDTLDMPGIGDSLSFTNVPVVMLDVDSPEGGTLDGIIGMNLLSRYNFVLRGGGMSGQPNPSLDFDVMPVLDVDFDNDGDVDMLDFAHLQECYTGPSDTFELAPGCEDMIVDNDFDTDQHDIIWFAQCASGPNIPAAPECIGQ